jgi:hypothetical protein
LAELAATGEERQPLDVGGIGGQICFEVHPRPLTQRVARGGVALCGGAPGP